MRRQTSSCPVDANIRRERPMDDVGREKTEILGGERCGGLGNKIKQLKNK